MYKIRHTHSPLSKKRNKKELWNPKYVSGFRKRRNKDVLNLEFTMKY